MRRWGMGGVDGGHFGRKRSAADRRSEGLVAAGFPGGNAVAGVAGGDEEAVALAGADAVVEVVGIPLG